MRDVLEAAKAVTARRFHGDVQGWIDRLDAAIAKAEETAPELLEAFRDLVDRCDGPEGVLADGSNIDTRWAHAVIAKVEGGDA